MHKEVLQPKVGDLICRKQAYSENGWIKNKVYIIHDISGSPYIKLTECVGSFNLDHTWDSRKFYYAPKQRIPSWL